MIRNNMFKKGTAFVLSLVLSLGLTMTPIPFGDSASQTTVYAVETSISSTVTAQNVAKVNSYATQLMNANQSKVGTTTGGFTWDTEKKTRSWTYYNGLMMDAFAMMSSGNYSYIEKFYNANISTSGSISNYGTGQLDSVEPIRGAFDLFMHSGYTSSNAAKYKKAINYIYNQLENQISFNQCGGNFAHKQDNTTTLTSSWSTYPVALDGIYMAQPFLMECANAIDAGKLTLTSKNGGTVTSSSIYTSVYNRMVWIYNHLYNSRTHLFDHASNTSGVTNGVSWSRAIGWYAAALVDVIDMMPEGSNKQNLISQLPRLFDGLIEYQDSSTGLWYNVTAYDSSLSKNKLETSGSALFAYAMLKAYDSGWVTNLNYASAGLRAFNGVVNNKLTLNGSTYSVIDTYISSGASSNPSDYLTKSYTTDEAKGVGGLLMASTYANSVSEKLIVTVAPPAPVLEDITITAPSKTEYTSGESLDLSGLTVTANYNNGSSINVTDYSVSALPSTAGTHTITVSYDSMTATFTVTVHEATGNWVITEEATCQKAGQKVQYCKACDKVMATEIISKTGHTTVTVPGKAATCTENGMTEGSYCSVCEQTLQASETISATGHKNKVTAGYPATCQKEGLTDQISCEICGEILQEATVIPMKDHTLVTESGIAPTCTEYGLSDKIYCSECGLVTKKATLLSKTSHTLVYTPSKAATCTESGYTKSSYCTVCEKTIQAPKTIAATGHTDKITSGYPATCQQDGLTDEISCSVCGEILQEATVIPKGEHVPVTDAAISPTCTTAGKTEGSHCKICKKVLVAQQTVAATGHTSVSDPSIAATCTEPGRTKGSHCSTCGVVIRKSYVIDPAGHTLVTVKGYAPTCTATGLTDGSRCSVCGEIFTEQEEIPATGHTEMIVSGYAPTCTTTGKTDGIKCSVCQKTLTAQTVIPATGHTSVSEPSIAATCTEPGRTKGSHCSTCGSVIRKSYVIEPSGHKKGAMEADGTYHCVYCGEEIVEKPGILDIIIDLITG